MIPVPAVPRLACDGAHGYAARLYRVGASGAGNAENRSPFRPPLRLSRQTRRSRQNHLAKVRKHVFDLTRPGYVRETFTCRDCKRITETPSPSHPIARGRAGPGLLAEVLFAKYRAHLPLNRQSDIYAKEGVDLDVSTLAGWVGAAAATLMPLVNEIGKHVLAAERLHADDTTVPVLGRDQCTTAHQSLDLVNPIFS